MSDSKIPIIDLTKLDKYSNSWVPLCNNVRHALEEYGYFIALYDDDKKNKISTEIFDVMEELFDLPIETKKKNTSDFYFYQWNGLLKKLLFMKALGSHIQLMLKHYKASLHLCGHKATTDFVTSYVKVAAEVEQLVDKMVFESYGVAERHYESHVAATTYLLRPIKYRPPLQGAEDGSGNIGCNAHTDKSFSTLLFQNQINALQVETKSGEWIDVDVPPSAFVFLAGDAYEAWSNGRIYAARHQVLMKEDKERYTLALFTFNKGITEIPEELVDETHPIQYKPFDNFGLAWYYLSGASSMAHGTAKPYCGINAT